MSKVIKMTLDELKTRCLSCTECELCKTRTQVVFGVGNPAADILLIGEGPGENEDLQGQPLWVAPASCWINFWRALT